MTANNTEPVSTIDDILRDFAKRVEQIPRGKTYGWEEERRQIGRICASEQTKAVLGAETEMRLKFDARQHDLATFEWMIAQMNDYIGYLQTQLGGETHE